MRTNLRDVAEEVAAILDASGKTVSFSVEVKLWRHAPRPAGNPACEIWVGWQDAAGGAFYRGDTFESAVAKLRLEERAWPIDAPRPDLSRVDVEA